MYHRTSGPYTQAQHWEHSVKHMNKESNPYWFERLVPAALCHSENFELSRHDSGWVVQKLEVGFRLFFLFFFILLFILILWREKINMILAVTSNLSQFSRVRYSQAAIPKCGEKPFFS